MAGELQALGRPKEAVEKFQRALDVWQEELGPSQEMITALAGLGAAKLDLNQPAEALKDLLRSQQMCERVLGPKHAWCGDNLAGLGEAYRRLQKPDEALALFRRSLSVSESALGSNHPQLVKPLIGIGRVELGWHIAASAIAPLERALAIRDAKPGDAVELADIRFALAQALWATGEKARAATLASQAQAAYVKAGAPGRRSLADLTDWLARRR